MNAQTQAFIDSLGDEWFERNKNDLDTFDPVGELIEHNGLSLKGQQVLEIGTANGWRLRQLQAKHGCEVFGIDPSPNAIRNAEATDTAHYYVGVAQKLPFHALAFDAVILGHCLWVIAAEDWFQVAAETSRVLRDGGLLIITDNVSPRPFRRPYRQVNGELIYQMYTDWPALWLGHPGYTKVGESYSPPAGLMCTILRKRFDFPVVDWA